MNQDEKYKGKGWGTIEPSTIDDSICLFAQANWSNSFLQLFYLIFVGPAASNTNVGAGSPRTGSSPRAGGGGAVRQRKGASSTTTTTRLVTTPLI